MRTAPPADERVAELVEAAYREALEDGRDGWCNENDSFVPDDDLWNRSHAKTTIKAALAEKGGG